MNLYEVKEGKSCIIISLDILTKLKDRLFYTGVFIGEKVTVINKAPFSGPVLIETNGVTVGLRKELAKRIEVKEIK